MPTYCLHGNEPETCRTWFCRYPALVRKHGHATISISHRGRCLDIFEDGHQVWTIHGLTVPRGMMPMDFLERVKDRDGGF